jgi:hypothetical protein
MYSASSKITQMHGISSDTRKLSDAFFYVFLSSLNSTTTPVSSTNNIA